MPTPLSTLLSSTTNTLILDGALATYLETLGADISSSLWSASLLSTNPSLIQRTHLDYFRAGANIAITASYQASIPGLHSHLDLSDSEASALIARSVELAHAARAAYIAELSQRDGQAMAEAKADKLYIAGSIGPYGAYLADGSEYTGSYSTSPSSQDLQAFHHPRIRALLSSTPPIDILAIETLPSYPETLALVTLLHDSFPGLSCWFSFTLRDASHISDGTSLATIASLLEGYQDVVAVGVNCVAADVALSALQTLRSLTNKPLIVYPNSGEQWDADARDWRGQRTQGALLAERARTWVEAGARIVGGCCRTKPEDIRVITDALREVGEQ